MLGLNTTGAQTEQVINAIIGANKIFGIEELVKALGPDNPYALHTLRTSLGSADSKITKNMSPSQQTIIKKGKTGRAR